MHQTLFLALFALFLNDRFEHFVRLSLNPVLQVLVHTRGLSRDPTVFDRADEFLPERFLNEDVDITGKDLRILPFGAGGFVDCCYPYRDCISARCVLASRYLAELVYVPDRPFPNPAICAVR